MIAGVIEPFNEYYVLLRTQEGEVVYWPKRDLAQAGIEVGATVHAELSSRTSGTMNHDDIKQLLNTLLLEAE